MTNYLIGNDNVSIVVDNQMYSVEKDSVEGKKIIDLIRSGTATDKDYLDILNSDNPELEKYCSEMDGEEGVTITDTTILIDNDVISESLANQIRIQHEMGIPIAPLVKFIRKLRKNPSYNIREQLWRFINASQQSGGFTISEDGDIIGYKKIKNNWTDIHSGQFDNSIGSVVKMDRSRVDDNPNHTCSAGLHFCAYSYLSSYGSCSGDDRVILVAVNPMNVVSIPDDYNHAKARCCEYKVIGEAKGVIKNPVLPVTEDDYELIVSLPSMYDYEIERLFDKLTVGQLVTFYNTLCNKNKKRKHFNKKKIINEIMDYYHTNEYRTDYLVNKFMKDTDWFNSNND